MGKLYKLIRFTTAVAIVAAALSTQHPQHSYAQSLTPAQAQKAKDDIGKIIDALASTPPTTTPTTVVSPGANLQLAIDRAATGATLMLDPGLRVTSPITISKSITLRAPTSVSLLAGPVVYSGLNLPSLQSGVTISGSVSVNVVLDGLDLRHQQHDATIVNITGNANVTLTNNRVLGDPVQGQHRGVAANGGKFTATGNAVDDMFATGQDTQAIAAWDSAGPFTIAGNYLRAAGENVLFGGGDPTSASRVPSNISVTNNYLTKRLSWRGTDIQVKNLLELKDAVVAAISGNTLEYCWTSGQTGYAVVLTPRNQDGRAPYSRVEDVDFHHNIVRHVAAAIQMLGTDDEKPSGLLQRVKIHDNLFTDINPSSAAGGWDGSDQMILLVAGPVDVTIDNNNFAGTNIGSVVYFDGKPKCVRLTVTNNQWPASAYGVAGADAAPGAGTWAAFVEPAGSLLANNTVH